MSDGGTERSIFGFLRVHVNPLVIASGIGKQVDTILLNRKPLAFAQTFTYGGFHYLNDLAGEVRDPQRTLPRALLLGMLGVVLAYVLANVAYLTGMGHAGLAASQAPAADLMRRLFGEAGARVMAIGIACSTFGYCSIAIAGGARVMQTMGADGMLFRAVGYIDPRTRAPQAYTVNYLKPEVTVLNKAVQKDVDLLSRELGDGFAVTSRTLDDSVWTVAADDALQPASSYIYDRKAGKLTKLFDSRPALLKSPLVPMQSLELKARDGLTLVSYLSLPPGSDANGDGVPDSPVPMVLNVHGGPWARDGYGFRNEHQWMANRGYAVLSVNYRGSTGFGKAFVNASNKEWAGKMHDDLLDAVKWAVDNKITTADKVAIYGGSYGGYATLVGLTFTPDTFACGVDIVGPSNLQTLLSTIPPYWKAFFEDFVTRVGDPRTEEGKKLLAERSPITHVAAIKKPLLIGQGANDPRVKQAESDQIVKAMKEKNIPVTYVLYPDEGHGFARPANRTSFYAIAEGFLAQCLGGRYEPVGNDFKGASLKVLEGAATVPGLEDALK